MREVALLMPEAVPAKWVATEFMTVVVSGATVIPIPTPKTKIAGKKVVQYFPGLSVRPMNEWIKNPIATRDGPTISGIRGPILSTSFPDHRDIPAIRSTKGKKAKPAKDSR